MERLKRITSVVVLLTFLFSSAAADTAFGLAVPSMSDDMTGIQPKDMGDIRIWFEAFLESVEHRFGDITYTNLLKFNTQPGNGVFQPAGTHFFITEAVHTVEGAIKIMVRRRDGTYGLRTYWVEYSDKTRKINVYPAKPERQAGAGVGSEQGEGAGLLEHEMASANEADATIDSARQFAEVFTEMDDTASGELHAIEHKIWRCVDAYGRAFVQSYGDDAFKTEMAGIVPSGELDYTLAVRIIPDKKIRKVAIFRTFIEHIASLTAQAEAEREFAASRQEPDWRSEQQLRVIEERIEAAVLHDMGHGFVGQGGIDLYSLRNDQKAIAYFAKALGLPFVNTDMMEEFVEAVADLNLGRIQQDGRGGYKNSLDAFVRRKASQIFDRFVSFGPEAFSSSSQVLDMAIDYFSGDKNPYRRLAVKFSIEPDEDTGVIDVDGVIHEIASKVAEYYELFYGKGSEWFEDANRKDRGRPSPNAKDIETLIRQSLSEEMGNRGRAEARRALAQYGQEAVDTLQPRYDDATGKERRQLGDALDAIKAVMKHRSNGGASREGSAERRPKIPPTSSARQQAVFDEHPIITVVGSIVADVIVPIGKDSPYPMPTDDRLAFSADKEFKTPQREATDAYLDGLPDELRRTLTVTYGGPAFASAMVLHELGAKVKLIGAVGDDNLGYGLVRLLESKGMDTSGIKIVKGVSTSTNLIFSNQDTNATSYNLALGSANEYLEAGDIKDDDLKASVVHLGGIAITPKLMQGVSTLIDRAKAKKAKVGWDTVVDLYGLEKQATADMAKCDYLTPSIKEATKISGKEGVDENADFFAKLAPLVFLKNGENGSELVVTQPGSPAGATSANRTHVPAVRNVNFVDGTGAGDSFSAFAAFGVATGRAPYEIAEGATVSGALTCERRGGGSLGDEPRRDFKRMMTTLRAQMLQDMIGRAEKDGLKSAVVSMRKGDTIYYMDSRTGISQEIDITNPGDITNTSLLIHIECYRANPAISYIVQSKTDVIQEIVSRPAPGDTLPVIDPDHAAILVTDENLPLVKGIARQGVPKAVAEHFKPREGICPQAVLTERNGVIAVGTQTMEAYYRNKLAAKDSALTYLAAEAMGHVGFLSPEQAQELLRSHIEIDRRATLAKEKIQTKIETVTVSYAIDYDEIRSLRRKLVETGRRVAAGELVVGPGGNISAITKDRRVMLIKASGQAFESMREEGYVAVDVATGKVIEDEKLGPVLKPSSETESHRRSYLNRPDIGAVCHTHPQIATGIATANKTFSFNGKDVPRIDYAFPGEPLAAPVSGTLTDSDMLIITNHGLFTVGRDLDEAFNLTAALEDRAVNIVTQERLYNRYERERAALAAVEAKGATDPASVKALLDIRNRVNFACEELRLESEATRVTSLEALNEGDILWNMVTKEVTRFNKAEAARLSKGLPNLVVLRPLSLSRNDRRDRDIFIRTLDSKSAEARRAALIGLKAMERSGKIPSPFKTRDIFQHCHTKFSHSPYYPEKTADRSHRLGLLASGVVDHDTIAGCRPFIEACKSIGFKNPLSGHEQRVSFDGTPFEGMATNSPGVNYETYIAFHGVSKDTNELLDNEVRPAKVERFRKTIAHINTFGLALNLDYDKDIRPICEENNPTERHVAEAIAMKIYNRFEEDDWEGIALFTKTLIERCGAKAGTEEILRVAPDIYLFTEFIRTKVVTTLKQLSELRPTKEEVVPVKKAVDFAHSRGEEVYYLYLGGPTPCEAERRDNDSPANPCNLRKFFRYLKSIGFDGIAFMPNRNTDDEIREVMKIAQEEGFNVIINGMDVNKPGQPYTYGTYSCDEDFVAQTLRLAAKERDAREAASTRSPQIDRGKARPSAVRDINALRAQLQDDDSRAYSELKLLYRDADWENRRDRAIETIDAFTSKIKGVEKVAFGRAPGRSTIDDHTDHGDGECFGVPTFEDTLAVVGVVEGNRVEVHNIEDTLEGRKVEPIVMDIDAIKAAESDREIGKKWPNFHIQILKELFAKLEKKGVRIPGLRMMVNGREKDGGVPISAGLSSSASTSVVFIKTILAAMGLKGALTGGEIITVARAAEFNTGFPCGNLDPGSSDLLGLAEDPVDVEKETCVRAAVVIDGWPRLDAEGRQKVTGRTVPIPAQLQAVQVDIGGDKNMVNVEYPKRVASEELGAWLLMTKMAELSPELASLSMEARQAFIRDHYPDIDITHNGRPELYNDGSQKAWPIFYKPAFFAYRVMQDLGIKVDKEVLYRWISTLPDTITRNELMALGVPKNVYDGAVGLLRKAGMPVDSDDFVIDHVRGACLHVISTHDRIPGIEVALAKASVTAGDEQFSALNQFGELQALEQESQTDLFDNSTPEANAIVEWLKTEKPDWCLGVADKLGARVVGAGWAGWMSVWIKPGRYEEARETIAKFLHGQEWYQRIAESKKRTVDEQLTFGLRPFRVGAPASIMFQSAEPDDGGRTVDGADAAADKGAGLLDPELPSAETLPGVALSDLASHRLVNAIVQLAHTVYKDRLAESGFLTTEEIGVGVTVTWLGYEHTQNMTFQDLFDELTRIESERDDVQDVTNEDRLKLAKKMRKVAGLGNEIDNRFVEELKTRLGRQVEHFGVGTGNYYAMRRYASRKDRVKNHVATERSYHRKVIDETFGRSEDLYRQWRKTPGKLVPTTAFNAEGDNIPELIGYNEFAQRAHDIAEAKYPFSGDMTIEGFEHKTGTPRTNPYSLLGSYSLLAGTHLVLDTTQDLAAETLAMQVFQAFTSTMRRALAGRMPHPSDVERIKEEMNLALEKAKALSVERAMTALRNIAITGIKDPIVDMLYKMMEAKVRGDDYSGIAFNNTEKVSAWKLLGAYQLLGATLLDRELKGAERAKANNLASAVFHAFIDNQKRNLSNSALTINEVATIRRDMQAALDSASPLDIEKAIEALQGIAIPGNDDPIVKWLVGLMRQKSRQAPQADDVPVAAVVPSMNASVVDEVKAMKEYAVKAGLEVTPPTMRCNLIVPEEFFADINEFEQHRDRVYHDRFDLSMVKALSPEQFIRMVLDRAAGKEDKTIVLVPDDMKDFYLNQLREGGIRYIRTNMLILDDVRKNNIAGRKEFQENTYAMMLLARSITDKTDKASPVYRMLEFYVRTHFTLDEGTTADEYIEAIIKGDTVTLLKGILSYRPTRAYDALEKYHRLSHALIFA